MHPETIWCLDQYGWLWKKKFWPKKTWKKKKCFPWLKLVKMLLNFIGRILLMYGLIMSWSSPSNLPFFMLFPFALFVLFPPLKLGCGVWCSELGKMDALTYCYRDDNACLVVILSFSELVLVICFSFLFFFFFFLFPFMNSVFGWVSVFYPILALLRHYMYR